MRYALIAFVLSLAALRITPAAAQAQPYCAADETPVFVDEFADILAELGDAIGYPIECAHIDADSGDLVQTTTTGLVRLDHLTSTASFTPAASAAPTPSTTLATIPTPASAAPPVPLGERSFADRPDDTDGPQIHLMYVLPSDGIDKHLDTDGTLDLSVRSFQRWFEGQTSGTSLHLDTYQGQPDITFVRLAQTDLSIRAAVCPDLVTRAECTLAWNVIQAELVDRQLTQPNKMYAVYYGGGNVMCGSAPTPPSWPGAVAVLYLNGQPPGSRSCATYPFTTDENTPGFFELNMVHEILHTLGIVPACAPHHFGPHVSDDPLDLMYQGPLPWQGQILDVGHDDYYLHGIPGCLDLKDSAFLLPSVNEASMPPRWGELPRVPPPSPAPAPAPDALPGRVVLADTFDDPGQGRLPTGRNGGGTLSYVGGEYQLLKTDPASSMLPTAVVPGTYADSSIALDVRFIDPRPGVGLYLRCRNNGQKGYRAAINPANGTVALARLDGDQSGGTVLVPNHPAPMLNPGVSPYHVELSCVGPVISLAIDNTPLISSNDATYSSGSHWISAGIVSGTSDVRLDNLVVTQR